MNENRTFDPLMMTLSPHDYTLLNGRDGLSDPGLVQLRRYLPVLAVIGAPYAGMNGEQDPLNPLDPVAEWQTLTGLLAAVTQTQNDTDARLALVRLTPPTAAKLGAVLAAPGPDSFPVVHLVCHGERDMFYLEDDDGYEAYAVLEQVAHLFENGSARLVVMDGCFSRTVADLLIKETPVQAVIGTRRRVAPENAFTFGTRLYAALSAGLDVRTAFRTAMRELKEKPGGQADRYEMVLDEDLDAVTLPLPASDERAARPLLLEHGQRVIGLPPCAGFVGRREELIRLAEYVSGPEGGVCVLQGPEGIGKSWLAAAFAARSGWRFPGGVIWLHCTTVTTVQEVIAGLAQGLEVSPYTPRDSLLAAFSARRALLVLDQVDAVTSQAEQDRLGALIRELGPESRVLVTARQVPDRLFVPGQARNTLAVERFSPKDARTLAMRLAVGRGVEALDMDTIDDFLDRTLNVPWLIAEGVRLVETWGIDTALDDLRVFNDAVDDPVSLYLRRRIEWLGVREDRALRLLARIHGLPEAFDETLARGLAGNDAAAQIETLLESGLMRQEGKLCDLPAGVRELVRDNPNTQRQPREQVDRVIMSYLAQTWPQADGDPAMPLSPALQARLNNTRALLRRQLHPEAGIDPVIMTRVLVAAGPVFKVAGLAEEYLAYAQGFRELLPDGNDLARLQLAMGEVAGALPSQRTESGWLFLVTLRLDDLERPVWVEAQRAFGRHMIHVEQIDPAVDALSDALKVLLKDRPLDLKLAALLAQDWANALALSGQHQDAIKRFGAALATYTDLKDAVLIATLQYDLSYSLIRLGELDRAEELLRQALVTADYLKRRDLAAQIRLRLAELSVERADQEPSGPRETSPLSKAAEMLRDAVTDLLPLPDLARLAEAYHRLGQVQAGLGQVDEGIANVTRSRTLLEQAGSPDRVEALVTLGQLLLAQGNSVAAEETLLAALDLAPAGANPAALNRAAGVLVRVHQLRARRISYGDRSFATQTLERAQASRAKLADLDLPDHAAALDRVIQGVGRSVRS